MRNGLLGVSEESVWRPDLVHHAVVQPQDFSGALEFQPLVNPHLTEEHVHSVLLKHEHNVLADVKVYVLGNLNFSFKLRSLSTPNRQSPSLISMHNTGEPFQLAVEGEER